ncbi:hypothetical protein DPMN_083708 [Dreissena polymorpha]|uniref:Uncharacterized protein n=1 Tax=Dreissena polymorpha TaxID=45954 RepID=A0A9D3Y9E8_DREPO|nr:hypothetical protein DPMN_083708 [Dreissena polymorpha]
MSGSPSLLDNWPFHKRIRSVKTNSHSPSQSERSLRSTSSSYTDTRSSPTHNRSRSPLPFTLSRDSQKSRVSIPQALDPVTRQTSVSVPFAL